MHKALNLFRASLVAVAAAGALAGGCAGGGGTAGADGANEQAAAADEFVAGSRCVEPNFTNCLNFGGGRACAQNCEVPCQNAVAACIGGGGGAACASRCDAAPAGDCQLPVPNRSQSIYQVCSDLRVTRVELVCMDTLIDKQFLSRDDFNIRWAYSNCWIIGNEGFDAAAPNLEDVVEQWLKGRGLL
jgi:hypothetical protein